LRYVNLSCCANTGYQGHYEIASYALDHLKDVSLLVLYMSLGDFPREWPFPDPAIVGGATRLHDALGTPFALLSPPSQMLRPKITDRVYSLNGIIRPLASGLTTSPRNADLLNNIVSNGGWLQERDTRRTGAAKQEYWRRLCGVTEELYFGLDHPVNRYYEESFLKGRVFKPRQEYERFARLAAQHGAKLAIVFQPNSCQRVRAEDLAILRLELTSLKQEWKNVIVDTERLFDHWPKSAFTSLQHARTGNEAAVSRRLARILSSGLDADPQRARRDDVMPSADGSIPENKLGVPSRIIDMQDMTLEKVTIDRLSEPEMYHISERSEFGLHRISRQIANLDGGKTYRMSIDVKPVASRSVRIELIDDDKPGRVAFTDCSPTKEIAERLIGSIDAGIDALDDGWYRCWQTLNLTRRATVGLTIYNDDAAAYYYAGASSVRLELRNGELRAIEK
jgi:hypothetical protein